VKNRRPRAVGATAVRCTRGMKKVSERLQDKETTWQRESYKSSGSIRIRVETMDYFLRRYREQITQRRKAEKK
jgi:predicted nucleotide-binding protein (sugar kinase/HSP70/actin superfamily)